MVRDVFEIPDGDNGVLVQAEVFLRQEIERLGGRLLARPEARGFGEYPSFEAQFDIPDTDMLEEGSQDMSELSHELAELYGRLDTIHEVYIKKFERYF